MGGLGPPGGVHALYCEADTPVHRLPPQVKIVATVGFVLAVVLTPAMAYWAFALHAAVLVTVVALARIPPVVMLRRMTVEIPFVVFALLIPFLAAGPTVELLGLELSRPGLVQAWNIVAKATLGVGASAVLASTTEVPDLLLGLQRLRVPPVLVSIVAFMVRYVDVILAEARRMRVARTSRGYDPRAIWEVRALAASVGWLFVRSYERGERVYLAMVSRGYDGTMPPLGAAAAGSGGPADDGAGASGRPVAGTRRARWAPWAQWVRALVPTAVATGVMVAAWLSL